MNCPNCGAFLGKDDVFCGECGQPVNREGTPAAVSTPEEVRDVETALLPVASPEAPAAPAPRPAVGPTPRPAAPAAGRTAGGKRFPLIAVLIAAGIALVGLCLCAGAFLFILGSNATPTPVAEVPTDLPTDVVDLEPTDAVDLQPTDAVDLVPTVVVDVPLAGEVLYEENFDEADGGWDVYEDEDTWAAYQDGSYQLGVRTANYVTWANPTSMPEFADFQIDVDTRLVEGPIDNNLGVLVRYQGDDDNYYWFQISSDGYYAVDVMQAGEWLGLLDWQTTDAINTGLDANNHIRVVCLGNQFIFYVNDTYLTAVTDDTYSSGSIGLAAGTFDEPGVVIQFDNLTVRALNQ